MLAAALPLALIGAAPSQAAAAPPGPYGQCPAVNYPSSCEISLVVNTEVSVSVLHDGSVGPYDGADDTLVGIVNQSPTAVEAVTVSADGSDLSGFDGDGLCSYLACSYGPSGYEGPGTSLVTSPSQPNSAEVDFIGSLQPGATAFFSLENNLQYAKITARKGHLNGAVNYVALGDSYSSGEGTPPLHAGD